MRHQKETAYTNAVQAAKIFLNKSNGQNKTKDQVTEAMNQVNSAKNNLDGTRLFIKRSSSETAVK